MMLIGYEESGTVIYKDPTTGLFTPNDDKGVQEIVDLCKVHKSDFKEAITSYAVHPGRDLKFSKNDKQRVKVICK